MFLKVIYPMTNLRWCIFNANADSTLVDILPPNHYSPQIFLIYGIYANNYYYVYLTYSVEKKNISLDPVYLNDSIFCNKKLRV